MHSSVSAADVVVFLNQRHEMWTNAFHKSPSKVDTKLLFSIQYENAFSKFIQLEAFGWVTIRFMVKFIV